MGPDRVNKRILVLSDDDRLATAIELNLNNDGALVVTVHAPGLPAWPAGQTPVGEFDLLVVAMSSPHSEPIVALARASLTAEIGQVPLLIISDRPFQPAPEVKIAHLAFPFVPGELDRQVRRLLHCG